MGRGYTVSYSGTLANASGDADLLEILPADDKPVRLVGMRLGQISEVGDAAEEGLRISVIHMTGTVTSGSGGSSVTPQPPRPGTDLAAGFAAECNNSTVATTSGTASIRDEIGWNIRQSPWETFMFDEKMQVRAVQTEAIIVRLQTTPADDITGQVTFFLEEDG